MSEDIFEKYAELAMERGLVSKGEDLKKKLEKNPRWDSQDISAIELLYGVKPDSPKEMEYKKNIVEIAHPNAVIVSPAHDALNGLVENLNERNNILINIVNKTPDGHLTGRKYASDELVRSLVRIANEMDNRDSEELRVLADTCIEQMNKQALSWKDVTDFFSEKGSDVVETGKGVGGGAAVGGIIGGILGGIFGVGAGAIPGAILGAQIGAVGGGVLAAITKTSPAAKNVSVNTKDTVDQLKDLIKKFPSNNFLTTLHTKLESLMTLSSKYAELSNNPTGKIADTAEAKTITTEYVAAMEDVKKEAAVFKGKAKSGEFAGGTGAGDKVKSVLYMFMDDDIDDVVDSLNALEKAIDNAEEGMNAVKTQTQQAVAQTSATPAAAPTVEPPKTKEEKDEFAELSELLKKYPQLMSRLTQK
jgi:hypothetical protein